MAYRLGDARACAHLTAVSAQGKASPLLKALSFALPNVLLFGSGGVPESQ